MTPTKARALTFVGPRAMGIEVIELPEPPPDGVLMRTAYSGISGGTEMLAYRGEIDGDVVLDEALPAMTGTFSYPFRYGYSCVGRIRGRLGPLNEGDLVFTFHPHQDIVVVDASGAVPLPHMSAREATLFPLVETALQVSLETDVRRAELVVVLGLGCVGILSALLVAAGGADVLCGEPHPWRRELAISLGLDAVAPEELAGGVARRTDGAGARCLIEASGNPGALGTSLSLLAHEGTALVVSWYGSKSVSLPLGREFHRRRLTLRSVQVSTIPSFLAHRWTIAGRREEAAKLMPRLPLSALATHEFAFEDAAEAFAAVDRGDEGLVHAALRY